MTYQKDLPVKRTPRTIKCNSCNEEFITYTYEWKCQSCKIESKKIWQKKENMIFKKDKSPKMVIRKCLMCSIERKIKHPNRVCEECKRTESWRDAMISY